MNAKQLKQYYAEDKNILGYIEYLESKFNTVEVYEDFHQMIHLMADIKDYEQRFQMQRALSFIYFYFPFGASVTVLPPIEENGFDYIYEFTCNKDLITLDAKRIQLPLQKFKDMEDVELDVFFMFDLEI